MGEQVGARLKKKTHPKGCFIQNGHILMGGDKGEACDAGRWKRCVNLIQQGSAVLYNWFLPVISGFEKVQVF